MLAYWIKSTERTVEQVEYESPADLQRMVGGPTELAVRFGDDVIFVDDDGLFKYEDFFIIQGGHQPFAGNGVYVGRELSSLTKGGHVRTAKPRRSLAEVAASIRFAHRSQLHHEPGEA